MAIKLKKKKVISQKTLVKKEIKSKNEMQDEEIIPKSYIFIDYPIEFEKIKSYHYAVRIGASKDGYVEVSFNNGEWLPCRFASGYWWFDWMYFNPGSYILLARLVSPKGDIILETTARKCEVY
jgi:hypothetical protein